MAFFSKAGNILRQTISKTQISHEISASTPAALQFLRFMSSKVFVGGLPWSIDDSSLVDTFSKYGEVVEARVITDRETGRSRGFGFVTYRTAEDASSAIQALDGKMLENRQIKVNLANDRPRTSGGGGYGGAMMETLETKVVGGTTVAVWVMAMTTLLAAVPPRTARVVSRAVSLGKMTRMTTLPKEHRKVVS
ncbi:unnamed protein product [Cuscuta campestris]|uniref:RRM domain-containing protein n=1 Tax=Cuscuta campestris TaxID=132261 RepID=A0A484N2B5_9ASTE|nr:unnamed protein product [Cuscuta campestris]